MFVFNMLAHELLITLAMEQNYVTNVNVPILSSLHLELLKSILPPLRNKETASRPQ